MWALVSALVKKIGRGFCVGAGVDTGAGALWHLLAHLPPARKTYGETHPNQGFVDPAGRSRKCGDGPVSESMGVRLFRMPLLGPTTLYLLIIYALIWNQTVISALPRDL
jgi:hypothetical protein